MTREAKKTMPTVPWIPVRLDLADDPAVIAICNQTDCVDEEHVVGKLHKVWSWFNRQTTDGYARSVTKEWIDRHVSVAGFAQAMIDVGWLDIVGGGLQLPNFEEFNSKSAKKRLQAARRMARKRTSDAPSVTPSEPPAAESYAGGVTDGEQQRHEELELEEEKELEKQEEQEVEKDVLDETRRDDHLENSLSWTEPFCALVLDYCRQKFATGPKPVFGGQLKPEDRWLLLKVATLAITLQISETLVDEGLEAIRHHEGPVKNRAAFYTSVLYDKAEEAGVPIKKLLAKIELPEQLLSRRAVESGDRG